MAPNLIFVSPVFRLHASKAEVTSMVLSISLGRRQSISFVSTLVLSGLLRLLGFYKAHQLYLRCSSMCSYYASNVDKTIDSLEYMFIANIDSLRCSAVHNASVLFLSHRDSFTNY